MKRYTFEEDQIIVEEVSTHPHNISLGLRIASERTGRTVGAVTLRWYRTLSRQRGKEAAFCIAGNKTAAKNRKVIRTGTMDSRKFLKNNIFRKILKILGFR